MRLGIGHPGEKRLVTNYVLGDFGKDESDWLDDLLRGIADGAPALAAGDGPEFLNAIARRLPPPAKPPAKLPSADKPEPAAAPLSATAPAPGSSRDPAPDPQDARSPLQKLVDRFR